MARNTKTKKLQAQFADNFFGATIEQLLRVKAQLRRIDKQVDVLLSEARTQDQIMEVRAQQ